LEEPSTHSQAPEGQNLNLAGEEKTLEALPPLLPPPFFESVAGHESKERLVVMSPTSAFLPLNGNNNRRQMELESDFIMALIGTPV